MSKEIQWEYSSDNVKWSSYSVFINQQIENEYQKKKTKCEIDKDGEMCIVDFGTMHEINKIDKTKMCSIRRDELKNRPDIKFPEKWNKKTLNLVFVDKGTKEYNDVIDTLKNNKFGNFQIISIERVQNKRIYIQYQAHKIHFKERDPNNVNEKTLFHGTTGDTVESIWKQGFNRSFCGKNATGKLN